MSFERYLRQLAFAGLGSEGQHRLSRSSIAIVGVGAIGGMLASLLARAGVGTIRIVDRDFIEPHNLQRQILFDEQDLAAGLPKALAAASRLRAINSQIAIEPFISDVNADSIATLVGPAQLVLDGSDNFETRYLINDFCVSSGLPWIYSGAVASYGMTMNIVPGGPCFRCLFPEPPAPGSSPTCDTAGVLGGAVATIAAIAATEAIKLLTGQGRPNDGLISVELWEPGFEIMPCGPPRPGCPACGQRRFDYLAGELGARATTLCGNNAVQVRPRQPAAIDLAALARRLQTGGVTGLQQNDYLLRFADGAYQISIFPDARAIIKGTDDPAQARSLYARWVGM